MADVTVISQGANVVGRISGAVDLAIHGRVEGEITVRGDLTIEAGGSVVSDVDAAAVVVAGSLEGNVSASGTVTVRAGAHVRGDLRGTEVTLEEGAEFAGRLDCEFTLPEELEGATKARR